MTGIIFEGGYAIAMIDGMNYSYPTTYGLQGCGAYDAGTSPYCSNSTDSPSWCASAWCFVDPNACHGATYTNGSSYFSYASGLEHLAYSYERCGDDNTFLDFYYVPPPPPPASVDCACLSAMPVRLPCSGKAVHVRSARSHMRACVAGWALPC